MHAVKEMFKAFCNIIIFSLSKTLKPSTDRASLFAPALILSEPFLCFLCKL